MGGGRARVVGPKNPTVATSLAGLAVIAAGVLEAEGALGGMGALEMVPRLLFRATVSV